MESAQKGKINKTSKEMDDLKKELEKTKKQAEEYLNGWKRARADYINLKRDTQKEEEEWVQFANSALILGLLPIMDNFKKAFEYLSKEKENSEWVKGIRHIKKQLEDLLKSLGVEGIRTVGEKFNPEFHEAVGEKIFKEKKEGIILEEVEGGYKLHGRVLRPAKVIVAKKQ
ncbi:MAG: nucleotide exchange factor GrpE [Parcubacteria group bacterium CG_4_10_14_0_8_um_filter_35_7]|nr:MAG: nucleotide exchange factor GrpE [Parcubacteria group bacterium CG23_combo_of_CG06-09_8_20_14_all_35_9]PIY78860.1 MAG: nucleotide exchange factor GrpE [Parcubacteria group bacterium CG_4_10_14_0_8_um_filter_35_7]